MRIRNAEYSRGSKSKYKGAQEFVRCINIISFGDDIIGLTSEVYFDSEKEKEAWKNDKELHELITKKSGIRINKCGIDYSVYTGISVGTLHVCEDIIKNLPEKKKLVSIEEFNRKRLEEYGEEVVKLNGISCPECGDELIDKRKNYNLGITQFMEIPVECLKCNFVGYRYR